MSFGLLSPVSAAALLAGAAALVAALYQLRPPPRRLAVSSLLLWRAARARPSPLERLRWWLSLLLATAVALLLALALAGARLGSAGGQVLLVVDTAPSMQALGAGGRSRLARAVGEAEALLDSLGGGARVRVADGCGESGSPGSPAAARHALARLRPCPEPGVAFPPSRAGERAVFLSDGVSGLEPPDGAGVVSVFEPAVNVGVTAFEVAGSGANGGGSRAVVELVNGSSDTREATLRLRSGSWSAEERLALASGEALALVRELPGELSGLVEALVVTAGDALPWDDRALAWLGAPRWRIRLLGTPGRHLELALRLDPRVEIVASAEEADAVVAVGVEAPTDLPALVLPAAGDAAAPGPRLIDAWLPGHPLLLGAPPGDAAVRPLLAPPEDGAVVASAGGAAAILARSTPVRRVRLAFSLEESTWTRAAAFPVFLGNALEWLLGPAALQAPPGDVVVPLPGALVYDPGGSRVEAWSEEGVTRFRADRPGTWLARVGGRSLPVLVSPRDRGVTLVNRSRFREATPPAPERPAAAGWPALPPLLLLLAALLLGFEWWSWRRRLTV